MSTSGSFSLTVAKAACFISCSSEATSTFKTDPVAVLFFNFFVSDIPHATVIMIMLWNHSLLNWPWPQKTYPGDPGRNNTHITPHTHTHTRWMDGWLEAMDREGRSINMLVMIIKSLYCLDLHNALFCSIWGTACSLSGLQHNEREKNHILKSVSLLKTKIHESVPVVLKCLGKCLHVKISWQTNGFHLNRDAHS